MLYRYGKRCLYQFLYSINDNSFTWFQIACIRWYLGTIRWQQITKESHDGN